ncbi:MAG: Uma2 family endonuclease [Cyanobacteriota bacterium]
MTVAETIHVPSQPTDCIQLNLPTNLKLSLTHADFVELAAANQNLRMERTATGELIVNPPTGWETGKRSAKITYQLVKWVEELGGGGIAFDSSTGFTLPNGADRSPDASWVSQQRWDSLSDEQKQTFANICPDLVVELRSSSDRLQPLQTKMQEYRENGARLGWLIDIQNRKVEIFRPGRDVELLDNPSTLSGEDVLPGFVLSLAGILT